MRSEHGYIYSQMAAERPLGSMSGMPDKDDLSNKLDTEMSGIPDTINSVNLQNWITADDLWFGPEAAPLRRKK